uniref:Uncharacterized protein n=1 Tax=Davidia involucrata TaxID=16924 RepID=A0A5B7BZG5_DAVIN
MSAVNITNVTVLDNPATFLTPFQFEISYECVTPLTDGTLSLFHILYIFFDLNSFAFDFLLYLVESQLRDICIPSRWKVRARSVKIDWNIMFESKLIDVT